MTFHLQMKEQSLRLDNKKNNKHKMRKTNGHCKQPAKLIGLIYRDCTPCGSQCKFADLQSLTKVTDTLTLHDSLYGKLTIGF